MVFMPRCFHFLVILMSLLALATSAAAQSSFDLRSPDGKIEVRIRSAKGLHYDVLRNGVALLEDSTASIDIDHKNLGRETKVRNSKESSHDEMLEPVVRQKFAKIRDNYKELRLDMDGGYAFVFRAFNEGIAYRIETSLPQQNVKVYNEEASFRFPSDFLVYYPQEDSFMSHNERKYLPQHLSEIIPPYIASLPAVMEVNDGVKIAIGESDVEDYPGLWLRGTRGFEIGQNHAKSKDHARW